MSALIDDLDRTLLALFSAEPRIGMLEASRRLRVARGTVQARVDRLQRLGVVTGWAPEISTAALGYPVTAFVTVEVDPYPARREVCQHLEDIAEVLECWTVTGSGDLWCRVVAHSPEDLQRVLDVVTGHPRVRRTVSQVGLAAQIPFRTAPLLRSAPR